MSSFSVLLRHKSLNYGNISLELHVVPIFRWESDISGTLSLYSADTCLKLERLALEMHILYCRTDICSWNLPVEVSLMLDDSFSVPFLCNHCVKVSKYRVYSGPYFSVFSQIQENTDQKKLRIWTLFTQWIWGISASILSRITCKSLPSKWYPAVQAIFP